MTILTVRPILFSGEMIKKIMSGDKTQTRRIAKSLDDDAFTEGDTLWVRETWTEHVDLSKGILKSKTSVIYAVDRPSYMGGKWRPSIHMPRKYSRLTLANVAVRIEPLHDITEIDARAEGVKNVEAYKRLWDKLNYQRAPWESNPLVFVIDFKPYLMNIDRYLEKHAA